MNTIPGTRDVSTPEDAYRLFLDEKLIDIIVKNTNKEGKRVFALKKKKKPWKDTDAKEISAFIGCLLHCGALHQNKHSIDILFSPADGNPLLRAAFSSVRFAHLLSHIRFDDKESRTKRQERDQFAAFREFLNNWTKKLDMYYVPSEYVTVDE